ncbi:hypothetical protein MKW94_019031, partial [Papaver nudicaule]|nr:hypothetical protein [Papaver nudicaule]
MEAVAQKFEKEAGILDEVQQQLKSGSDLCLQSKLFPGPDQSGYVPYCDIRFEQNLQARTATMYHVQDLNSDPDILPMSRNSEEYIKTEPSLAYAASTLCSFLEPKAVPAKGSEEVPIIACKPSKCSPLYDKSWSSTRDGSQVSHISPNVDQCDDDSDTEIFRVKRRSTIKMEQRSTNNTIDLKFSEQQ